MPPMTTLPMGTQPSTGPRLWATSADGEGPDTRPTELEALCSHLQHCTAAHSRLAAMQGSASRLRGFVLGHLVSSLAVMLALPTALWLLLAP
jgi:anti-sigma factor RsiW